VFRTRSPRTSSGPAGSRVMVVGMGRLLRIIGGQAVVEGTGWEPDDLGHGVRVAQVGADPGSAADVEHLRQPADARDDRTTSGSTSGPAPTGDDAGPLPASASLRCHSCSLVQPAAGARRSVWRR
jgi:hypothetical protein